MLQFETLLLEQLQRQQSRAEFCDTVLQSQDVSVPVHSCVLSAFSPWLCGALSTMPTLVAGQKRLIELQHMEACTLLSLVSLLYSGQIDENRKDVLSAAELLGIRLPQEHTGETPGGRKRSGKESAVAEQHTENTSQGAMGQHVDRLEISGREKIRESSTQTEHERETDDRETQTDHICSDYQQHFHVIDHTACSSISHVQNTCTSAPDATVMLQGAQLSPVKTSSTCEPLPVAPETGVYHIDALPCLRSPRSSPHVCSLPLPPCSSSFCQNTMGAPEPSLLHTVSLPPAPQMSTQSIDLLLDDIMLGLNVLPPVHAENPTDQSGFVYAMTSNMSSVTKTQCPSINSLVKPTDASQQQPEGELFDILDHFLNTFEQHVAGCNLDAVEETANSQSQHFTAARSTDGTQVSKDPSKYTRPLKPHSNNCHMPHASVSSHFTSSTQLQPIRLSPADTSVGRNGPRLSATLRQRNSHSGTGSRSKLKSNEKEPQTQRVTRSQSRKRKLELTLSSLQSTKKRCRGKRSSGPVAFTDTERSQVRQRSHIPQKHVRCEDAVSNAGAGKSKPTQIQSTKGPKSTTTHSLYKKRQLETKSTEEKRCRTNAKGSNVQTEHTSASSWTRPVKKKIGGAYIEMTSSAFEKMRMLLEKQRKGKEEYSRTKKSIGKPNENVGVVNVGEEERVSGVKGGSPAENTMHGYLEKSRADRADESTVEAEDNARTVRAKTRGRQNLGCRPENKDVMAARMEQMMTNEHSRQCQTNLLPDTEPVRLTQVGEDSDHNNNEPFHSTAESSQSTFYSSLSYLVSAHAPHLPCSHQDLTPSAKSTRMVDLTVDLGEITPTTPVEGELSQHNLLSPEKAEQESAGGSEEDEEVDVLEVSSSASEPVTMSTAFWGPGLSSEEEDIEEDTDVDVLGMESD